MNHLRTLAAATLLLLVTSCAGMMPVTSTPPGGTSPHPEGGASQPPTPSGQVPVPGQIPVPGQATPVPTPVRAPAPTGPLDLDEEPLITIGLKWDADTLILTPVDGFTAAGRSWDGARTVPARSSLRFRATPSGVLVQGARGNEWDTEFMAAARETCWLAGNDPAAITASWNGKRWRGALGVFANPRGKLTLVTRLPLEAYLHGVVPGEIGALGDDRIEAGKAQAIAARSYTLFYMGRRAAEGFDLYGTVEDQLYSPVEAERPLATKVVDETRAQVALSDGQPIRANYCSTCGGITADVWEAWPNAALPYLVSHRDKGRGEDWCASSTHFRWRETWTADEFMANLARYAEPFGVPLPAGGLGELVDVKVESRSRSGRVWWLGVRTTTGELKIPAYVIRQVLRRGGQPGSILRSNLFKIGVRRNPETRAAVAVVASGAGNGHGVGLCQTGALAMAKAGEKARDILEHYYPSAEIKALY